MVSCNYKIPSDRVSIGRSSLGRSLCIVVVVTLLSLCLHTESVCAASRETSIAGRVFSELSPVKGARVYIYKKYDDIQAGRHFRVSDPTGADGLYRSSVPQGRFYFVSRGSQNGKDFFAYHGSNPVNVDQDDAWITFFALEKKSPVVSSQTPGLKGVVSYKGQPVKGAYVTLYKPESKNFKGLGFRTESVAGDGTFNFNVPDGKYVVVAKSIESGKGNRPLKTGDLYCYYPDNPVEVDADISTTIEVPCYPKNDRASFLETPVIRPNSFQTVDTLGAGFSSGIKGTVTDSAGKPLAGILVLAYRTTKPVFLTYHLSHGTEYTAETASDGSYFIPLDTSGDYYLVARDTLGDGPHRGELYGLYNGNSRHVVAYQQGTLVDNIPISASRIMDEPKMNRLEVSAASGEGDTQQKHDSAQQRSLVTDQVIAVDTVWRGRVTVKGVVVVKKGVTLTIMPGTVVSFSRIDRDNNGVGDGELRIEGCVLARGTSRQRIVFTSDEANPQTRDWSYIHLLASPSDSLFEYCRFEYGFSGMQVHYSNVRITDCIFSNNHEGLHFNTANVVASNNSFDNNGTAIRFKRLEGKIIVSNNDIHDNEIGVLFGRQQINAVDFKNLNRPVEFPLFVKNNLYRNKKYNFSMGEGQNLDIDVKDNWWGATTPQTIEESIFDANNDPALGRVRYAPFLEAPVNGAGTNDSGTQHSIPGAERK